jgi:nucleoside-diphosphate-sugar epimerase
MRLFITGSESFVGRALALQCRAAGIEYVGIDAAPVSRVGDVQLDVRSADVTAAMPERVDAVIHLAAMSRDADCVGRLADTIDVNVMGTLNVLRAAAERGARQFIFASTEWVYDGLPAGVPRDESAAIDPRMLTSEYALSKLMAEAAISQRYSRGSRDSTILRFGIIYGPRPGNWSAVESLAHAVNAGGVVTVGSPETARRFIHVTDVAAGILRAVGLTGLTVVNLGGPRLVTLREVVDTAARVLGKTPVVASGDRAPSIRDFSIERSKAVLAWEPGIDLEDGLRTLLPYI